MKVFHIVNLPRFWNITSLNFFRYITVQLLVRVLCLFQALPEAFLNDLKIILPLSLSKHSQGRGGKGNIYVWATGNGGLTDDDCNCDGYTTSIYTISVGCIGDHGLSAYYTELCSSTLGVTFNGGSHREKEENKMVI